MKLVKDLLNRIKAACCGLGLHCWFIVDMGFLGDIYGGGLKVDQACSWCPAKRTVTTTE